MAKRSYYSLLLGIVLLAALVVSLRFAAYDTRQGQASLYPPDLAETALPVHDDVCGDCGLPPECTDSDGDHAAGVARATGPSGATLRCGPLDCDDGNASISPGAREACWNGVDEDCDGEVDDGCGLPPFCTDSDGGVAPRVVGSVTFGHGDTADRRDDGCVGAQVVEWYCEGAVPASATVACQYGCAAGACRARRDG